MEAITSILAQTTLAAGSTFRNLTVFPLLAEADRQPGYLTLDEALAQGVARVSEVSEGGSVPELTFANKSDLPVLLLDGEELVGAKQNRILNLTILVPARTTLQIPVSCVEAGRWSYRSQAFAAAPRVHYADGRARRVRQVTDSLKREGERRADQGAVWSDISAKMASFQMSSPTAAMADIYEQQAAPLEDYVGAFAAADLQAGALFAVNGAPFGFDLFDSPATLRRLLPKLVRSYALDAIETGGSQPKEARIEDARAFLKAAAGAAVEGFPAIGMGQDVRLTGDGVVGAGLVADGRVVHLSAFRLPQTAAIETTGVARASARARFFGRRQL